ncbi:MAG: DNA/RNA nuclease SfsA [Promethearchaeota archaeon]
MKIPIFSLEKLQEGTFISRLNRFVAEIERDGKIETAHVHDPGRLKELLIKGAEILFTDSKGKLKYYIRAVKARNEWVLIDTAQHSKIARKVFDFMPEFKNIKEIKSEVIIGKSRIDFTIDGTPLEVKGVTLVKSGLALFPDAPTERGTRHIGEIIEHKGIIFFLVFRDAKAFAPNIEMDQKFSEMLSKARKKKIRIIVVRISFNGKTLFYQGKMDLADF